MLLTAMLAIQLFLTAPSPTEHREDDLNVDQTNGYKAQLDEHDEPHRLLTPMGVCLHRLRYPQRHMTKQTQGYIYNSEGARQETS